jgi:Tn3 transposase DDE domain
LLARHSEVAAHDLGLGVVLAEDPHAVGEGPLNGLARNRINTRLITGNWDEICRLTASLRAGTVIPSAILRTLQRGPSPSSLARALAELGRVIKTLHVLEYAHDPAYRRTIHHLLSRGERRNSLARAIFHGQRGQLRRHYQVGQENQLDSLGIMINVIVLWQTVYIQAALDHLAAKGYPIDPADVARLTPLGHPTINLDGRYRTTNRPPAPDSGRYESTDSGSCTNPRHRPSTIA